MSSSPIRIIGATITLALLFGGCSGGTASKPAKNPVSSPPAAVSESPSSSPSPAVVGLVGLPVGEIDGANFNANDWEEHGGVVANVASGDPTAIAVWRQGMAEASICPLTWEVDIKQITFTDVRGTTGPDPKAVLVYAQREVASGLKPAWTHEDARLLDPVDCTLGKPVKLLDRAFVMNSPDVSGTILAFDVETTRGIDLNTGKLVWEKADCGAARFYEDLFSCDKTGHNPTYFELKTGRAFYPAKSGKPERIGPVVERLSSNILVFPGAGGGIPEDQPWKSDIATLDQSQGRVWSSIKLKHLSEDYLTYAGGSRNLVVSGRTFSDEQIVGYIDSLGTYHHTMRPGLATELELEIKAVVQGRLYVRTTDEMLVLSLAGEDLGRWSGDWDAVDLRHTNGWSLWTSQEAAILTDQANSTAVPAPMAQD